MSLVLIVDDKPDNRYLLRVLLQGNGHTVEEANHGADALTRALAQPPDLVISDLLMPVMDGYSLLRRWKTDDRLCGIPFIVYTASYTDPVEERLALDLGADAFLLKPIEPDVLAAKITQVLDEKSGTLPVAAPAPVGERVLLERYNQVLVSRLEEKARLLEESNATLLQKIAEYEEAVKALRRTSNLLQAVMDGTDDAIFVKDLEGRYLICNPATAQFVGKTVQQMIGHTDSEFFETDSAEVIFGNDHDVIDQNKLQTREETLTSAGVTRTYLATKAPYRDADGNIIGMIGISRDISDRKRLELQLRQAQKMEAIGRLAGGVAHDFNNLLSVIIGYAEFAIEEVAGNDAAIEDVQQIRIAADKAAALTKQLLVFSRKQVLRPEVLCINDVISESARLLQRLIGEDIELVFDTEAGLGSVQVDASQLEQVVMNLAVNARDAMPRGGNLTFKTSNVMLDSPHLAQSTTIAPGAYVMLAVSDTGCGMDAETKARIFEPFFTTKGLGEGTGLGLATVYGIVEQSGGHITVYSELGIGTTFKIFLPRVDAGSTRVAAPVQTVAGRGSESLLLVEDDPALRGMTERVLEKAGFRVHSASNGAEALELVERNDFTIDLVLTDVVMPRLSGRELMERLAPLRPGVRVLYMSGFMDDAIVRHGISQETIAFISKPFTAVELIERIRQVLGEPASQ